MAAKQHSMVVEVVMEIHAVLLVNEVVVFPKESVPHMNQIL